jgi:glucosamine-6-phosphate deaminase
MKNSQKRLSWNDMLTVPPEHLAEQSLVPVTIYPNANDLFSNLARYTIDLIKESNQKNQILRIGWPIGPKKHFPLLVQLTHEEKVSWKNTVIFQVDEWLTWDYRRLSENHPYNLQSYLKRELINKIDPALRPENVIFHDPNRLDTVDLKLDEYQGMDVLFGGYGFSGHIAFNEPPTGRWSEISVEEYRNSRSRFVNTNDETIIMHSHRSTGGNTRLIPPVAMTIGMKDILASRKILLISDGGAWKQTITRILCFHEPTVKYPCTLVQGHHDVHLHIDAVTASCPSNEFIG